MLKDLFKNSNYFDTFNVSEVEQSDGLLEQHAKSLERYIPDIDYSNPANFVRFGLAEEYYKSSVRHIIDYFPYDGSTKEKLEWENKSSDLDMYLTKNLWPKTNGFANFSPSGWGADISTGSSGHRLSNSPEYIAFKTGPNVDNLYLSGSRIGNFRLDSYEGNTVEFWLKKSGFPATTATSYIQECIIHLAPHGVSDDGRLRISIFTGSIGGVAPTSGYAGISYSYKSSITEHTIQSGNCVVLDGQWHHYALSFKHDSGANLTTKFYRDGLLAYENSGPSSSYACQCFYPYTGTIGALCCPIQQVGGGTEVNSRTGYGKLSGSLDEVRVWNTCRSSSEIYNFYNFPLGGGTNTDDANLKLGVYFKFNEGITSDANIDSIALDYSGRSSNGSWVGYSNGSRETGSAFVLSGKSNYEPEDLIIYETHPDVAALSASLIASGSLYDGSNCNNILNNVPSWILRETEQTDNPTTKNILHIVSTVLDDFHVKAEKSKELKSIRSIDNDLYKPNIFIKHALGEHDFQTYETFLSAGAFEEINSKDEEIVYQEKLDNIKNAVYQNIYNNLVSINKSKGTLKSVSSLLNSIGLNSDLIRTNLYANNSVYTYEDNHEDVIVARKYLRFSRNPSAILSSSNPLTESQKIVGPAYCEVDLWFPKLNSVDSSFYSPSSITGSSIVTIKNQDDSSDILSLNFQKAGLGLNHGRFVLSYTGSVLLTSDLVYDLYDNRRAYVSFGLFFEIPETHYEKPVGIHSTKGFLHVISDEVDDYQSADIGGEEVFNNYISIMAGAVVNPLDFDLGSLRMYAKGYERTEGAAKALDVLNYGTAAPHQNYSMFSNEYVPNEQSLFVHWAFDATPASDGAGEISVDDLSSGSYNSRYGNDLYGYPQNRGFFMPATGSGFNANSDVVTAEYIINKKQRLPEMLCGSDMVKIIDGDEYKFRKRDVRPTSYIHSLERSLFQNISQEMLNVFSSIDAFNNIIGEPVQKYRKEYKALNKLRNLFFEKVQNVPDIERYVGLYKWIDDSIISMISNVLPASLNSIENGVMIESHILERSKYANEYSLYRDKVHKPDSNARGIGHRDYKWDNFGTRYFDYKWEKEGVGRVPVHSSSLYHQKANNIYDVFADNVPSYLPQACVVSGGPQTVLGTNLVFRTKFIPQTASAFDWSTVGTVDYWDVYSLNFPSGTPVPEIVGGFAGTILTGSRASYSGSFYDSTYSEVTNYPRSAWLDGKKCISRHANVTANYATSYRFNGINPLSGSTNLTLYWTGANYSTEAHPYFIGRRGVSDGYFTPGRSIAISKSTSGPPDTLGLTYTTTGGSSQSFPGFGTILNLKFYLFIMSKSGLNVTLYAVSDAGYEKYSGALIEEIWPVSDNLNFVGHGTDSTSTRICENASFTWVSLHSGFHDAATINSVIEQINIKQGSSYVTVA